MNAATVKPPDLTKRSEHPVGAVHGGEQRILVFGDADLFSNANSERQRPFALRATAFDSFHWITDSLYPIQRSRHKAPDQTVRIGDAAFAVLRWSLLAGGPILILLLGGLILLRRRRS